MARTRTTLRARGTTIGRRLGVGVVAGVLAAGAAVGFAGPAAAYHYEPVMETPAGSASCFWAGKEYSHGARVEVTSADGGTITTYRCDNGAWKFASARAA